MNTGLYLRAGETAEISATGTWIFKGDTVGLAAGEDTTPLFETWSAPLE